ncbi:MAG: hypothetical protein FJW27_03800 [Acidimicrobiia bacterium]|nr:hypothetical protein [Acidimicrobiia bacterium]
MKHQPAVLSIEALGRTQGGVVQGGFGSRYRSALAPGGRLAIGLRDTAHGDLVSAHGCRLAASERSLIGSARHVEP